TKMLSPVDHAINYVPTMLQCNAFWESTPLAMSMRYEDFWQDSRPWVVRLASQIGAFSAAEIDEINAKYSFNANRERATTTATQLALDGVQLAELPTSIS